MEKLRPWISSFDYEEALYRPDYKFELKRYKRIRSEFEYMMWFFDERPIVTEAHYSSEYLSFLNSLALEAKTSDHKRDGLRWGNVLDNLEFERWLNSRLTTQQVEKSLFGNSDSLEVLYDELYKFKNKAYLVKEDSSFSGRGVHHIDSFKGDKNKKYLIEPIHQRTLDLGHSSFFGDIQSYINYIDQDFQYKGSLFFPEKRFETLLSARSYRQVLDQRNSCFDHYKDLGVKRDFAIDSYFYLSHGELRYRPLVEINYRRTMGWILLGLMNKWSSQKHFCALFLVPNRAFMNRYHFKNREGLLFLSPGERRFSLVFISAKELNDFYRYINSVSLGLFKNIKSLLSCT